MSCIKPDLKVAGNILIIEDSSLFHNALKKGLTTSGHTAEGAFSLEEALLKLEKNSYDLIVLDLHLPDGEGEDLLENLNAKQKLKIVVYTSDPDKERRNEWFRYGVLGYLSKKDPFGYVIDEIDRTIQGIFENVHFNILLIDDSSVVRRQVTSLLQPRNYQVFTAIDAKQAYEEISKRSHDLILLDLELPDANGEEILKYLKKNKDTADIAVIVMTGSYDADVVRRLIKQGASEFFLKPFIAEELLMKIDFWIDSKRKTRQIECERQLLQEYKDTVDRGSIVSKTDKRGVITFVNDKFCEISGYSLAELIGKPHNMVRHPDMPKSAFKEMWNTILNGQIWEGVVKNRKKDGSAYWVQTIINPIIDIDGQIVEFIGIRHDITALEVLKERMNKDLKISTDNFETMQKRVHQYEDAMNHTMAVMRTTNENIITYVNKTFCDISGYSPKDVIGLECSELRAKKHLLEGDCEAIKKKLANKEIVKFSFVNVGKEGNIFHTDTTIYPIVDNNGKVIEHLHLMCNISDLISLHEEIENTQREIIYKMGEIGESRSKETGNHVRRVAEYSKLLALLAGLNEKEAEIVAVASPMHDIGKVAIPDAVLLKPGKLNEDEWMVMRSHSAVGSDILNCSQRPLLKAAAIIAKEHHEKFDGTGYPMGLSGEDIHIYGRIVAIADVFDALGSNRVYKKAWELEKILYLFHEEKGRHFDPRLVDLFLGNLNKFLKIRDLYID
ncbi:response regulator [Sulfurimonas crateris]|uniref:Response regulator n=1 Tax=Sulfurimonas crateris TaxID=2574727 RepID=A0A4U2Z4F7_9BACT|nr:response regulator [Sulfurimonas crateris]TKI68694.1 response regulator [Sulfurimonas crateris]